MLKPELQLTDAEIINYDLIVDLNKLFSNPEIKPNARIFRIYGNIIQLSNDLTIPPLNGSGVILIAARRIEIKPGCQIIVNYKKTFRIVIYAKEMTSELEIIVKNQLNNNDSSKFVINESKDDKYIGKLLTIRDGKNPEYKDIYIYDNNILKNHSFLKILRYSLLIASVLFYDEPEITRSILSWIVRITREFEEAKELYYHGLTILTQFNTVDSRKKDKFQFIPPLDMNIYKNQIDMLMEFIKYYEEKYKQVLGDELKKEKLDISLADCSDLVEMYERLNDSKKKQYESAQALTKKIESELKEKQNKAKSAFDKLEDGIKGWLDEQRHEAQKKLVIAFIELSISVGKIVVQPGGIFSFVETIYKVTNSVQEALAGVDVEKIMELYEITTDADVKEKLGQITDLNNQVDKIQKINNELESKIKNADGLNNNTKEEHRKINYLDIEDLAKNLETVDRKGILLNTEWELTRRRMIKILEFPVKQNIEGTEKYLNSLENFFIFIDSYIKAKIEETESSEELLRTNLQEEMSKSKKERLEQMIKNYKSNLDSKNYDEIKFLLIENLIDTKFWLMIYLENYLGAYEYWSLSKSAIKLSVTKEFRDHQKDMKKISHELMDALEQFGCYPDSNWCSIEFKEKKYIEEFKHNRSVIIEIPLNCESLSDYAHLKLHAFRLYLEGVGSENDIISLHISNTGTLANRDKKNQEHYFRSEPIPTKEFKYKVHSPIEFDKSEKYILHDNKYYQNDKNIYFVPTPFCQWKLVLILILICLD